MEFSFCYLLDFDVAWTFKIAHSLSCFGQLWPLTILGSVWFVFSILICRLIAGFFQHKKVQWRLLHPVINFGIFMALTELLKISVGRFRPEIFFSSGLFAQSFCLKDIAHSFPSSHAAIFIFLAHLQQSRTTHRAFWYLLALVTGLSRVILLKHFLFDVLFGFLWGYLLAKILLPTKHLYKPGKNSLIENFFQRLGYDYTL